MPATAQKLNVGKLSGVPDVVWFNPKQRQLYVAVGDPGVADTIRCRASGKNVTEKGAQ
jgi:hypothetical protein